MILTGDDTITAIATPQGVGAISVVRVSGPDSFRVIDKIFKGKKKIAESQSHTIHYGKIFSSGGEVLDDVLVSVFRKPNSYTGEDSVEISTHGSPLIAQKIIELLLNNDVRLAEPGEFTKRAFLNNKIDLAQAEAVADIINSRTEASLRGARNQLDGLLSKKINFLREELINISSLVELELDFAEEDIEFVSFEEISNKIKSIIMEIDNLLDSYSFGKVMRDGVNVAIVGKPNVGKSSLMNYILKESRAIVSHIPGTTRDIIREEASIDGILFKFFDTAGIRSTSDEIEREGVKRSREAVQNSDVVIFVNDITSGFDADIYNEILKLVPEEKIIKVFNKTDLKKPENQTAGVSISALTGDGIDEMMKLLKEKAFGSHTYTEKSAVVSNLRHYNALKKAKESLGLALESVDKKMSGEFIAADMRNAENQLGEIIGKVTTDDILNNIFSNFCIGK